MCRCKNMTVAGLYDSAGFIEFDSAGFIEFDSEGVIEFDSAGVIEFDSVGVIEFADSTELISGDNRSSGSIRWRMEYECC